MDELIIAPFLRKERDSLLRRQQVRRCFIRIHIIIVGWSSEDR